MNYETCARCALVFPLLDDGRIFPHRLRDNSEWCEGAHRPDETRVPKASFDLAHHRARHQQLYRSFRELLEDWSKQTTKHPQDITLLDFARWCRRQHDVPDHDDIEPHYV